MDSTREYAFKRVKERTVWEAKQSVDLWRNLFKNGEYDSSGKKTKYTLQQAAQKVGIPKKTLEDYHQLLRKASELVDLEQLKDKKMGYLRDLLKQHRQCQQMQQEDEFYSDKENEQLQYQQEEIDEEILSQMIVTGEIPQIFEECFTVQIVLQPQLDTHKKFQILDEDLDEYETDDEDTLH